MVKVVMVSDPFYPDTSGGSLVQWKLAKVAVQRDHDLVVVTSRLNGELKEEVVDGVEIKRPYPFQVQTSGENSVLDLIRKAFFATFLGLYIPFLVLSRDADLIYSAAHVTHGGCKVAGVVTCRPVVNFVGYSPSVGGVRRSLGKLLRILERINFRLFLGEFVYCRTVKTRDFLEEITPATAEIIHGVVNGDKIRSIDSNKSVPRKELPGEMKLVWVGRQVPIKQPKKAIEILENQPSEYGITFVGGGPLLEDTRKCVKERSLENRVKFYGQCSHDKTLRIIKSADALLLTSETEAYPTVIFEALSLGRHAFAPCLGVLPEIQHPRLHLNSIDSIDTMIKETELTSGPCPDKAVFEKYSMDTYADTMIETWVRVA